MRHPIGKKESVVFGKGTLIEHQQKLTTIRSQPLNRVGKSGWKEPKISFTNVVDEHCPIGIEHRDTGIPIFHEGPFVGCVPVQFAKATCSQSHIHASKISRGRQFSLRDLVRPTTFFQALACQVE